MRSVLLTFFYFCCCIHVLSVFALCLMWPLLPVPLHCSLLIAPSAFSEVYIVIWQATTKYYKIQSLKHWKRHIDITSSYRHEHSLSWFGADISINRGGNKLAVWYQSSFIDKMMSFFKSLQHVEKMPTHQNITVDLSGVVLSCTSIKHEGV